MLILNVTLFYTSDLQSNWTHQLWSVKLLSIIDMCFVTITFFINTWPDGKNMLKNIGFHNHVCNNSTAGLEQTLQRPKALPKRNQVRTISFISVSRFLGKQMWKNENVLRPGPGSRMNAHVCIIMFVSICLLQMPMSFPEKIVGLRIEQQWLLYEALYSTAYSNCCCMQCRLQNLELPKTSLATLRDTVSS